jgi:hypothetical protein
VAGAWQDGIGRQLIVGDRFEGMLSVEVRFVGGVGGDLTASGYQGVLLTLEYPDAPPGTDNVDQRFLTGANVGFTWRARGPPDATQVPLRGAFRGHGRARGLQDGRVQDEVLLIFIPPRGDHGRGSQAQDGGEEQDRSPPAGLAEQPTARARRARRPRWREPDACASAWSSSARCRPKAAAALRSWSRQPGETAAWGHVSGRAW